MLVEIARTCDYCLLGSIELISGIASLLKPVDEFMGMNVIVVMIFFIQGCSYFLR